MRNALAAANRKREFVQLAFVGGDLRIPRRSRHGQFSDAAQGAVQPLEGQADKGGRVPRRGRMGPKLSRGFVGSLLGRRGLVIDRRLVQLAIMLNQFVGPAGGSRECPRARDMLPVRPAARALILIRFQDETNVVEFGHVKTTSD